MGQFQSSSISVSFSETFRKPGADNHNLPDITEVPWFAPGMAWLYTFITNDFVQGKTMIDAKEIAAAFGRELPSTDPLQLQQFAQLLAEAIARNEHSVDIQGTELNTPTTRQLFKELEGQEITDGQTVISFGKDNQFGNITFRNVAGGNVYEIHMIHIGLPQVARIEPNPRRPPNIKSFVGRVDEITELRRRLNNDHLAVIVGMPGQGKTTLASKLAAEVVALERVCWFQLRASAGFDELVGEIAEFLASNGEWALWDYLQNTYHGFGKNRDVRALINQVARQLQGRGYLLCLDDFHIAANNDDVNNLTERLCELARSGELLLLIASRERPGPLSYSDCLMLGGLLEADIQTLLVQSSRDANLAAPIYGITSGNALFVNYSIDILRKEPDGEGLLDGRHPQPRRIPRPDLLYAQVVKQRERGLVVAVTSKVVFGDPASVKQCLRASCVRKSINTSFVERENLTLRQHTQRLTRDTIGFSKDQGWLETHLWLVLAYYHLVLPHTSLAQAAPVPTPTRGMGTPRRWLPVTPAMAAGITDHIWTTTELLSYRVPADFLDQLPELESLFPPITVSHHGN